MKILKNLLGFILAPFVKGSSIVIKDGNNAIKISKPKILVRLFYLVFCSRWTSPYESFDGMRRAFVLRKIANHATSLDPRLRRPVFAKPVEARIFYDRPALVTKWVHGEPAGKQEVSDFLQFVEDALYRAGLPTWSVSNLNPRAYEDVLETDEGLVCTDYESVLPNIFARNGKRALDPVDLGLLESFCALANENGYSNINNLMADFQTLEELEIGGLP